MPRIYAINSPERIDQNFNQEIIRIGRLPENDIVINDILVSRRHCEIRKVQGRWKIFDLDSLNGTYVNNLRVKEEFLSNGDVIVVGNVQLVFEELEGPKSAQEILERELVRPVAELENELRLSQEQIDAQKLWVLDRESRFFYILYQLSRAFSSANDLEELLDLSLALVFQVINADRGVILLCDSQGELELRSARVRAQGKAAELEIPVSQTIARRVMEEKAGIITNEAKYDPRFKSGESIVAYNIRSALCVPIWDGREIRGVIYLDNLLQSYAFGEEDLRLLTAIANHLALALQAEELRAKMKEEAIFRAHLSRFHSPEVVNYIFNQLQQGEKFTHQVSEQEVSVLFADICGFTRLCEQIPAGELAELLNKYFDQMSEIIFKYHGTIDKFIGDAIMAIFGAPIPSQGNAFQAVKAGIEMLEKTAQMRGELEEKKRFRLRIGINTGKVVAGYFGSRQRLEYTVLGDVVNTASRLQELALPNSIFIGESTYQKIKGIFKVKEIGSLRLRGKEQKIRAYQVLGSLSDKELSAHLLPPEVNPTKD